MIVNDYQDISSMVKTFRRNIGSPLNLQKNASIGHQGAGWDAIFNWSPNIGIWMVADDNAGGQTRYWTAFGIGEPSQTKSNSIIVEINFPRRGIDGRIAGLFWRTENNQILVLHSGKVGGGRHGIGMINFLNYWNGNRIHIPIGNDAKEFIVACQLDSPSLITELRSFVETVYRFKSDL